MALNVGRWIRYAQARLSKTTEDANAQLDRLEAEREAERAEKPWLGADGEAPTLAEARARIEWEAERQRKLAEGTPPAPTAGTATPATGTPAAAGTTPPTTGTATPAPTTRTPAATPPSAEEAEMASARIELDRRAAASKERLAAIREELGIDPPVDPPGPAEPGA
jgi:hypothetical protein